MAVQTKQIKKLNVNNFLMFLNEASTKNAQHVLDIKDGKIYTKITNEGKEFIKYASGDLLGIGGDWSDFKDGAYRFYMTDMDKIIKAFEIAKNFNKDVVNVKATCIPVEESGYTRIEKLGLEGQLKLQISAKDGSYNFHYVEDDVWAKMLAAPTVVEYDWDQSDIGSLKKIFNYLTSEDLKTQKEQAVHIHLLKDTTTIKFTEEDEKVFALTHDKNVAYTNPEASHLSFHAYILGLFDAALYRVHIKVFGEAYILVAVPAGDAPKTILIPLFNASGI